MRSHLGLSFFQRRANAGMLRSIALTVALATGLALLLSAPAPVIVSLCVGSNLATGLLIRRSTRPGVDPN